MSVLTLRLQVDDRIVHVEISTENKFPYAVSDKNLLQDRFWNAYCMLRHAMQPSGPPLPEEIRKALE